jgi:hypothetical protein
VHIRWGSLTIFSLAALLLPASGQAQSDHAWVSGSVVAAVPATDQFAQPMAYPYRSETLSGSLAYPLPTQAAFELGAGLSIRPHFGLGLAVSRRSTARAAAVAISVPDPYRFNAFASANGVTATPLSHTETSLHLEAGYVRDTRTTTLRVFAGPSIVHITQDVITDVQYAETATDPGVHTVALTGETYGRVINMTVGVNVGMDGAIFLTRHLGVGGLLRLSRASATIKNVPESAGKRADAYQDVRVGSVTLGAGVRVRF